MIIGISRRAVLVAAIMAGTFAGVMQPAVAQTKLPVVATFSILGDFVREVGGDRIELTTLVGPNGDGHVYNPTPADARRLAGAKVVFANGLGFEGWIGRLIKASGTKATVVTASSGVAARPLEEEGDDHGHGKKGNDHGHDHGAVDPHAWQAVANAKIYVGNVRDGLSAADPAGAATYGANASAYLAKLDALEAEIRATLDKVPPAGRKVITTHDAFGYFEAAYGVEFLSPQGVSTEAEANAKQVAKLIRQIKAEGVKAVFVETVTDPRLIKRIAEETGAKVGGEIYSDALSDGTGPAATYIAMVRHNVTLLVAAMLGS